MQSQFQSWKKIIEKTIFVKLNSNRYKILRNFQITLRSTRFCYFSLGKSFIYVLVFWQTGDCQFTFSHFLPLCTKVFFCLQLNWVSRMKKNLALYLDKNAKLPFFVKKIFPFLFQCCSVLFNYNERNMIGHKCSTNK